MSSFGHQLSGSGCHVFVIEGAHQHGRWRVWWRIVVRVTASVSASCSAVNKAAGLRIGCFVARSTSRTAPRRGAAVYVNLDVWPTFVVY